LLAEAKARIALDADDPAGKKKQPYYYKDPKKAIKEFFDRYGEEPEYFTDSRMEHSVR
jgi:hypothetical protein